MRQTRVGRVMVAGAAVVALGSGCTQSSPDAPAPDAGRVASASARPSPSPTAAPSSSPTASRSASSAQTQARIHPSDFRRRTALRVVDHLAGRIGPRHATSQAYVDAARWVSAQLRDLGYRVQGQPVRVPGGDSWGVPVSAGTASNVVAMRPDTDLAEPHLIVGAHLDTVPQAPGAEDNASGVGVLLAVAAAAATAQTRLPVVFVAFGAEEPRGPTDADHHYGSRAYVASMPASQRRSMRGMLSLDRVGVGAAVPVGSAVEGADPAHRAVLAAAGRAGVQVQVDANRSSDHWQFVLAGLPGVRLGSTPYAAYHSAADVPDVIDPDQLTRTGRIVIAWLARD